MDGYRRHLVIILFLSLSVAALGQVPALLNYQGKIAADGFAFNGIGQFKVALLNADGTQTYWLNAADGDGDGIPDESLNVPVNQGL